MLKGVVFRKSHRLVQNWFSHRGGGPLPPEGAFPFPTRGSSVIGPHCEPDPSSPVRPPAGGVCGSQRERKPEAAREDFRRSVWSDVWERRGGMRVGMREQRRERRKGGRENKKERAESSEKEPKDRAAGQTAQWAEPWVRVLAHSISSPASPERAVSRG